MTGQPNGLTVSELHQQLTNALTTQGHLNVHGVVTSWRPHRSGWRRAEIAHLTPNGVATAKMAVGIPPNVGHPDAVTVGSHIEITGTAETHPLYTPLQLQATHVRLWSATSEPTTALAAHLEAIAADGRLHANKRRPAPDPLRRVGIVTAASGGAGLTDPATILSQLHGIQTRHYPTPMMGTGSAQNIAAAVALAAIENDVVLLCRGGGAAQTSPRSTPSTSSTQ